MKECLWFINKQHTGITGHQLGYNSRECLYTVTGKMNWLRLRVEETSFVVNAPLLHAICWLACRKTNAKSSKFGGVKNKVETKRL